MTKMRTVCGSEIQICLYPARYRLVPPSLTYTRICIVRIGKVSLPSSEFSSMSGMSRSQNGELQGSIWEALRISAEFENGKVTVLSSTVHLYLAFLFIGRVFPHVASEWRSFPPAGRARLAILSGTGLYFALSII